MKGNFQIVVIIIFIAAAIFGVLVFSGMIPLGEDETLGQGTVVLWGTVPTSVMSPVVESFNNAHPTFTLSYIQKAAETFNQDLLEALASGKGPDLFLLPDDLAYSYKNKITLIPYSSFSASAFKNTFAGAGEVFMTNQGIMALPLTVDPMVMYYNRRMLDSNNIVYPPSSWDEFPDLVSTLTKKDENQKITKSAFALGQFSNVAHAKDILSALFMQMGGKIIGEENGAFVSKLGQDSRIHLDTSLKFYTDFADPLSTFYSWNKSLPNSRDSFSREDLAFYMGYASELGGLVSRNPNLNFLAASLPQIRNSSFKLTPAKVTGVAISQFSKNINTAFLAASDMATGDFAQMLALGLKVPPARRNLLAAKPEDAYFPIFYSSALYSKAWLDPSPKGTDDIFRLMVEKVLAGTLTPADAIMDASAKLGLLLIK